MIRTLKIWLLRWRCWWLEVAIEIDNAAISAHTPSLRRNVERLEHLEHQLDMLYRPESIIMQALKRSK